MNNLLIVIVILAILGGGYYLYTAQYSTNPAPTYSNNQQSTTTPQTHTTPNSKMVDVILSAQNDSNQSAEVILEEMDNKIKVTINMKNGTDIKQPAHIHLGLCPKPGAVKYPLTPVVNGKSETTIDANLDDLKKDLPLAINIHKSEAESGVYVACGNLFAD